MGTAHPTASSLPSAIDPAGRVALYAQYEDYHSFIQSLLRELVDFVDAAAGQTHRFKICVDSSPLAEKALAVRAGLGFIGAHHLLIHPQLGPQVLLGELLTTLPLRPDAPSAGTCFGCRRCVEACPTGALRPDGFLDAGKCISCLTQYGSQDTIQNSQLKAQDSATWLFGCDECLLACPFFHNAPARANQSFRFYPDRAALNLQELLAMDAGTFDARFRDSPIKRSGLERLQQNARLRLAPGA